MCLLEEISTGCCEVTDAAGSENPEIKNLKRRKKEREREELHGEGASSAVS